MMSIKKLQLTQIIARYKTSPEINGKSRAEIEIAMSFPIPGSEKTFSIMMLPPRISVKISPSVVITLKTEFLKT